VTRFPRRDSIFRQRLRNVSDVFAAVRFALRTRFDTTSILGTETDGKKRPIHTTGFEKTAKQCGQRKSRIGRINKITRQPRNFNGSSRSEQNEHLYGLGGLRDTSIGLRDVDQALPRKSKQNA
jgi:hypothetical protein